MCKQFFEIIKGNLVAFILIFVGGLAISVSLRLNPVFDVLLPLGGIFVSLGFSLTIAWASDKGIEDIRKSLKQIADKLSPMAAPEKLAPAEIVPAKENGESEKEGISINKSILYLTRIIALVAVYSIAIQVVSSFPSTPKIIGDFTLSEMLDIGFGISVLVSVILFHHDAYGRWFWEE